jgi:hypothetical protein
MTMNPYSILKRGIDIIDSNKIEIEKVIRVFESKGLSTFDGIRPTLPLSAFPSFEIETEGMNTTWGTTRGQRHTCSFRCLITVAAPNISERESYLNNLTSVVTGLFRNPQNLEFALSREPPSSDCHRLTVYDSFVGDVRYSSAKEGTIGIADFTWVASVHESIPDLLFRNVPTQSPSVLSPVIREIRDDTV